ncbi:hypothetical protein COT68_01555 [bacterium (Candidatus Torokbacteria) CG09_land_8_20_14_0_10_42_11]|nr:MAG: hypothetical protein COT68_01555 [bacterium (Candidatus Torokbacteria) CG09_land_8_20_14_0_10_42_11]
MWRALLCMFININKNVGNKNLCSLPKIAIFSNTFGPKDAMGKHLHLIKKVFPQAEIFLERGNEDPGIPAHTFYFARRYPHLALYMLEWKLGKRLKFLEWMFKPFQKLAFYLEARKFSRYDVVWAQWGLYHNAIHLLPALRACSCLRSSAGRRALKQKCPKIIFDYHGVTPPDQIMSRGKRLIAEKTIAVTQEGANCADLCLVRSHFMERELRNYGKPRKIIFNPLPFLPIKSEILPLREKYHLENKKILLYVGRISEHKNLAVVIGALQKIEKKDVCFAVVGNDRHLSLAAEKERLIDLSRKLKVQDQMIFTGEVSEAELFSWYKICNLFVMPSLHEGFCWPLVDAMAYGAPILATREGAIPETVGNAALFFDAKNPSDLSAKLIQILDNQELRGQLARLGKEKAKEYSWEKYKNILLNAVEELLNC